jgi:hypothetical protein
VCTRCFLVLCAAAPSHVGQPVLYRRGPAAGAAAHTCRECVRIQRVQQLLEKQRSGRCYSCSCRMEHENQRGCSNQAPAWSSYRSGFDIQVQQRLLRG